MIGVLLVAVAVWRYAGAYARSIQPSSFRSFAVSGEGRAVVVPDIAQFSFSVLTEGGADVGQLQESNTAKMNQALRFLKDSGVNASDIKTEKYDLSPRYETANCGDYYADGRPSCPPPKIVGYSINQTVAVKIRQDKFGLIGPVLSGIVKQGANSISRLNFTVDNPTRVESEARAQAIAQAKEKAKAIARAGGFSLGQLLALEEGGIAPAYSNYTISRDEAAAPAPSVEPGSQEIRVTLTLRYEID